MPPNHAAASSSPPAQAVKMFGRYQLLRLIGKSVRTMVWLALDSRGDAEVMLCIPRQQAATPQALDAWLQRARKASRLQHPHLASVVDVGEVDRWPYVAYERNDLVTWPERLGGKGWPLPEMTARMVQILSGLAFAHEAGMAHRDLQPFSLLVDEAGNARLMGLEIADALPAMAGSAEHETLTTDLTGYGSQAERSAQRGAAAWDLLSLGLVLHQALAGAPPLDEPDVFRVIERMPPQGRDIVRLPWQVPQPVPEALRAIVNRATDRQERQRYRSARTLQRALEGWLKSNGSQDTGALALLQDRIRQSGLLPSMPGGADRVAHLALLEQGHVEQIAELVLQDLGLSFELLREVNLAQTQAGHAGNGPVLSVRRAIAMLGLSGLRHAALSLRRWPGKLDERQAAALDAMVRRVKRTGQLAQVLQPAGYAGEVVFLLTSLQNLGWLAAHYHFPDEAAQILRLMQPGQPAKPGDPADPGMTAQGASFAVLGVDIDTLGAAVMRLWGLDETVQQMVRRIAPTAPVHPPDGDADMLRVVASCANETIEAVSLPARLAQPALVRVVQRYGRILHMSLQDLQEALHPQARPRADRADAAGAPSREPSPQSGAVRG